MFGSNSYLGLTNHPKIKEAAIAAIRKYGTGCAGSRFLNGTLDIHEELEHRLAKFVGKEEAIIYSTGFQVNLGVVSCVTGRGDYILWDELDHASIIEGRRLSFSTPVKYRHNDMQSLEDQLRNCNPDKVKLIVTDGVFSMEGDVANLPEIVRLAKQYNAAVMVDEAHGIGVFGRDGRGTCDHFGVTAAVGAALDIMESEPERIANLWDVTNYALEGFRRIGCEIGNTCTPIIPLFIRDNEKTFRVTRDLFDEGIFVNPVVSPAVAPKDTLIRFSLMATHTRAQVDVALEKIEKCFKHLDIIK